MSGHTSEVTTLAFSNHGDMIYSGSQGGTVHVWDLPTAKEVTKLKGHATQCLCLAEG
ncbi:MAG: WD40 repeat domain-containing protein [Candidatus Roizmanbacteria bacterium]